MLKSAAEQERKKDSSFVQYMNTLYEEEKQESKDKKI
jgi:hypothetical protein